jgi:hypothetical protein
VIYLYLCIVPHLLNFVNPQINTSGGGARECMPREWNTPKREPWNAPIHQILKAVDTHTHEYLKTQDTWHLEKAQQLRDYITELKEYIHKLEGRL